MLAKTEEPALPTSGYTFGDGSSGFISVAMMEDSDTLEERIIFPHNSRLQSIRGGKPKWLEAETANQSQGQRETTPSGEPQSGVRQCSPSPKAVTGSLLTQTGIPP